MYEFAASHAYLIPVLPLLACVIIALLGRWMKPMAHLPAIAAMICSFVLAMILLMGLNNGSLSTENLRDLYDNITWFSIGGFTVHMNLTIDHLTAIYLSFITGIGLLIFIYAAGYMKGDYGYWRFFAYMSIFVFFMCILVMGGNFILLYLGWEGVGLASYLLIGYYYPRPSAVAAAKKAFITNRIGDFGLAIGVFLIYTYFGSVDFSRVLNPLTAQAAAAAHPVLYWLPFCLMLGAFGKSAQFPLHVWLPDAMEGPTPVSALIHAATMVTAGIYLIARTMPLFTMIPGNTDALNVVAIIGGFTAFLAASIAMCQYDLKRIWAYSTLSQLGYMFLGLGVMATDSAVFHVFTHAFFKALLFLAAGSVMHAMGGELDIRKMSGVKKVMPKTRIVMLIGCLALAGFPGFAGFFSKDEIIHAALNTSQRAGWFPIAFMGIVAVLVALMTAYYTFRLYFKVFEGPLILPATAGHHEPSPFALADDHGHDAHGHADASHGADAHGADAHGEDHGAHGPNDGSPLMWMPLMVLAVGAVGAGYLGFEMTGDWFHPFLNGGHEAAKVVGEGTETERISHGAMMAISGVIAVVGIFIAAYFYLLKRSASEAAARKFAPLVKFLYNKWYIDDIYSALLLKPMWFLAHILRGFDRFIDILVFIVAFVPQAAGYLLKPTQRGLLQRYAVGMIAGLAAVVLGVLYHMYWP